MFDSFLTPKKGGGQFFDRQKCDDQKKILTFFWPPKSNIVKMVQVCRHVKNEKKKFFEITFVNMTKSIFVLNRWKRLSHLT